ncbi:hypothetical protein CF336_g6926 [Tilletia laevis]|nr:hypothetical protein CF328_g9641 [Tilletia controversa]KAE8178974.1 hypothetical protein CF335_g9755 [Tilletia laevis]KAE8186586.1 hypothetical protein CF336_g6926 [Tilletia laevis]
MFAERGAGRISDGAERSTAPESGLRGSTPGRSLQPTSLAILSYMDAFGLLGVVHSLHHLLDLLDLRADPLPADIGSCFRCFQLGLVVASTVRPEHTTGVRARHTQRAIQVLHRAVEAIDDMVGLSMDGFGGVGIERAVRVRLLTFKHILLRLRIFPE